MFLKKNSVSNLTQQANVETQILSAPKRVTRRFVL